MSLPRPRIPSSTGVLGTDIWRIDEIEFSARTANSLKSEGIVTLGDLVAIPEPEFLRFPNFGRKSLNEVKEVLAALGLSLAS